MASVCIETQAISRHQLYFHQDVPYTSHNSSMCTEMDIPKARLPEVIDLAMGHLSVSCAAGSDPGLCVACADDVPQAAALIAYGRRCKCGLTTKDEAYRLAMSQGIHLSEHGGSGDGVIGALAGVGLRMFGFDGRIKGNREAGSDGDVMTVSALLEKTGFSSAMAINGVQVPRDASVILSEGLVKAVRMHWQSTILIAPSDRGETYVTVPKQLLNVY